MNLFTKQKQTHRLREQTYGYRGEGIDWEFGIDMYTLLYLKWITNRTSLVVQWIRLCTPNAGGPGSIPDQGTRSHMQAATKSLHGTTKEPVCHN